jgi:hypothetical protein
MNEKTRCMIRNKIWAYLENANLNHLVSIRRVVNSIIEEKMKEE